MIPTASPQSVALPGSDTAADAPQAPAVAESAANGTTTYSDPQSGVSFQFPASWRPWHPGSPMYQPGLVQATGPAKITQVFDPKQTSFEKTNLVGLSFSYAVKGDLDAAGCAGIASTIVAGGGKATPETINGVTYQRLAGGDAGMCHQMNVIVDTTSRGGRCYVFERDFETICPAVRGPNDPVALTSAQAADRQSALERVMGSVVLR